MGNAICQNRFARFEVLTTVTMKITVFWDVTPYSLIDIYTGLSDESTTPIVRVEE
jgi:hypothetical protein